MANPFELYNDRFCDECGDYCLEGEMMYFHEDDIICWTCADMAEVVCECDNYKRPEYEQCYECYQKP